MLALFSDIHGNLEALNACLAHARAKGAERYAFLGDLVGYGADARAVVEIVMQHARDGALVVKGNHDEAVARGPSYMNEAAREAIEWARGSLSSGQKTFLEALPLCAREGDCCLVHASAHAPERWSYVDSAAAALLSVEAASTPYTFCGHVHEQVLFAEVGAGKMTRYAPIPGGVVPLGRQRRWLAVVGSVGQPRDGHPAAAYALFDPMRAQLTCFRVPYDYDAAAEKIRAAGLPHSLAYRVQRGV